MSPRNGFVASIPYLVLISDDGTKFSILIFNNSLDVRSIFKISDRYSSISPDIFLAFSSLSLLMALYKSVLLWTDADARRISIYCFSYSLSLHLLKLLNFSTTLSTMSEYLMFSSSGIMSSVITFPILTLNNCMQR